MLSELIKLGNSGPDIISRRGRIFELDHPDKPGPMDAPCFKPFISIGVGTVNLTSENL